eukprot:gene10775-13195_t
MTDTQGGGISSDNNNNTIIKNNEGIQDLTSIGAVLISQGAEAKTYRLDFQGLDCIVKERFIKNYRHPILDQKISNRRILQESRSLNKCRKSGIDVPALYLVDTVSNRIFMEFVNGITAKQYFYDNNDKIILKSNQQQQQQQDSNNDNLDFICKNIGKELARIHDLHIIHGDLTTSNILLRDSKEDQIVFIDFGLSFISNLMEDKAVDLYVLERAFISTHPNSEYLFSLILQSYKTNSTSSKTSTAVLNKLEQVRLRGRKKLAFG